MPTPLGASRTATLCYIALRRAALDCLSCSARRIRPMSPSWSTALAASVLLLTGAPGAQQPASQLPKSQMPDLGRPTKSTDALPLFDFSSYFTGRWTFEWDVPESILGPAGTVTGTTTYTRIDDTFFEAATEAAGPAGRFTMKE